MVVVPDIQAMKLYPKTSSWVQESPEAAIHNKDFQGFLSKEITDHLRKSFGGYEIPQKFLFITEDFTVDNGMLTQTMKIIRHTIIKKYGDMIQDLFKD